MGRNYQANAVATGPGPALVLLRTLLLRPPEYLNGNKYSYGGKLPSYYSSCSLHLHLVPSLLALLGLTPG